MTISTYYYSFIESTTYNDLTSIGHLLIVLCYVFGSLVSVHDQIGVMFYLIMRCKCDRRQFDQIYTRIFIARGLVLLSPHPPRRYISYSIIIIRCSSSSFDVNAIVQMRSELTRESLYNIYEGLVLVVIGSTLLKRQLMIK